MSSRTDVRNTGAEAALSRLQAAPIAAMRAADLAVLQQTIGNQLVQRILRHGASASIPASDASTERLVQHRRGVLQRKRVLNLASGTSLDTLMRPKDEYTEVVNVDSGHMAVAEILIDRLEKWNLFGIRKIYKKIISSIVAKTDGFAPYHKDYMAATADNTKKDGATVLGWLRPRLTYILKTLFNLYPGATGPTELIKLMEGQEIIDYLNKIKSLGKDFKLGDIGLVASKEIGTYDEVHVVNSFGFDVLGDPKVFLNVGKVLRQPDGLLFITAELTGPSVFPALGITRAQKERKEYGAGGFPGRVGDIGIAEQFKYVPRLSGILSIKDAFGSHKLLEGLTTRHTGDKTAMDEAVPYVRLVFQVKGG